MHSYYTGLFKSLSDSVTNKRHAKLTLHLHLLLGTECWHLAMLLTTVASWKVSKLICIVFYRSQEDGSIVDETYKFPLSAVVDSFYVSKNPNKVQFATNE